MSVKLKSFESTANTSISIVVCKDLYNLALFNCARASFEDFKRKRLKNNLFCNGAAFHSTEISTIIVMVDGNTSDQT